MQISNVARSLVSPIAIATHYFKESSWKGRTLQILLAGSLICWVVVRLKTWARSSASEQIKRSSTFASQRAVVKPADVKLAPASYRDKDFVQHLLNRIDSSVWGADIVKSISEWKEDDQPFVWKRRMDHVVKWLSDNQLSFENTPQDPRLPTEMVSSWKKMQEGFRELAESKKRADEKATCLKFKNWIIELQKFAQNRKEILKPILSKELEKIQERHFKNLDQYIQYLFSDPRQDSMVLGIERDKIWTLGLATLEDIGVLHLRDFDQRILTLRQLCCCLNFELQGGEISPELQETVWAKIREFRAEMAKVRSSSSEIKLGLKILLDRVDAILTTYVSASLSSELLATLPQKVEELEHWDKVRQMIFLRKYIQQKDHAEAWTALRGQEIHSLSQYCRTYEVVDIPKALYQLATNLHL